MMQKPLEPKDIKAIKGSIGKDLFLNSFYILGVTYFLWDSIENYDLQTLINNNSNFQILLLGFCVFFILFHILWRLIPNIKLFILLNKDLKAGIKETVEGIVQDKEYSVSNANRKLKLNEQWIQYVPMQLWLSIKEKDDAVEAEYLPISGKVVFIKKK